MPAAILSRRLCDEGGQTLRTFRWVYDNLSATRALTAADDDTQGYAHGSKWVDRAGAAIYFCLANTSGAAVWVAASAAVGSETVAYQAADLACSSNLIGSDTDLTFAVGSSQTWAVAYHLLLTGSGNGAVFDVSGPSGTATGVHFWATGNTTSKTVFESATGSAFGTKITPVANGWAAGALTVPFEIRGAFSTGASGSTSVTLRFYAITNTQTQTVVLGSYMVARRLA